MEPTLALNALENQYKNGMHDGIEDTLQYVITHIDELINYYEQPQDKFEMGFRQGIYRTKMLVENMLKDFKESEK